ncbi:hypothetical protein MMC30_002814 [Trapelia coarctata]|nr:hypothetical protein [Trapelia coarctata]
MPFHFSLICQLLSHLEKIFTRQPPFPPEVVASKTEAEIHAWFSQHRLEVDALGTDGVALISSLLPEKRSDRVYQLQPPSLTRILGRCFSLGTSRMPMLQQWERPGGGDLGICVERVLNETPFATSHHNAATIEEIDAVLTRIASRCRFSGPSIRGRQNTATGVNVDGELSSIYHRLTPCEAKWFTRMLLKDYSPVTLPEGPVLRCFHHLLPGIMKMHDNFESAVGLLRGSELDWASAMPSPAEAKRQKTRAARHLVPSVGVKIGRPFFLKAWSVEHTVQLAHGRRMNLERKYDGEYCQIHVDLSKPGNEIKIFSKSGKDSTVDRQGIHDTIRECLRLGQDDCAFNDRCILEGELVLWSDKEQKILDFHKIRKHLDRSGVFLGTAKTSQQHPWEHLMIVFFDVMLIDESPVLHQDYRQRRVRLGELINVIPGRADLVTSEMFDFSSWSAPQQLVEALATAFAHRWEGYVLKPIDEPYVSFQSQSHGDYRSCWIKLKKDKIPGLGDTADFAVIGARYDAQEALKLGVTGLLWTSFYIGCLQNKTDVLRLGSKPRFSVLDGFDVGVTKHDLKELCDYGKFSAERVRARRVPDAFDYSIEGRLPPKMGVVFTQPLVVEVKGTGFDKPPNTGFFTLRFPRIIKIHLGRSTKEAVGFDELQAMAKEAMDPPEGDFDDDVAMWKEKLLGTERGGRKQLCSWEGTQERDIASNVNTNSPVSLPISPRNTRTSGVSTFVRMDTTEMLPAERRLAAGEVAPQSSSPRSASSMEDSGTPPSSPLSSPVAVHGHTAKAEMRLNVKLGKRLRGDCTGSSPVSKRLHVDGASGADRRLRNSNTPSPEARRPVLSSISNNAAPRAEAASSTANLHRDRSATSGLTLVKKIPALSIKKPAKKSRSLAARELSSPLRETTASEHESTTASSSFSEQPKSHNAPAASAPTPHPAGLNAPVALSITTHQLPDPSPTAPSSLPKPPPSPSITKAPPNPLAPGAPDFSTALTTLSPCLTSTPYVIQTLLPAHSAHIVAATHLLLLSPHPNRTHSDPILADKKVVLLVESFRDVATAAFLRKMLPLARAGCEVEVWDWRVLEAISEGRKGRRWFLGWVRCVDGVEGVVWKGGSVSVGRGREVERGGADREEGAAMGGEEKGGGWF